MRAINRATRPFYAPSKMEGQAFFEGEVTFDWHSGMSWKVRQRSSDCMRGAILAEYGERCRLCDEDILEVSTASHDYGIGQALSAMNLLYTSPCTDETYPVENWFQAAKVFQRDGVDCGPYRDLLNIRLAKRYINPNPDKKTREQFEEDPLFQRIQREIEGSKMCRFQMEGEEYPLIPKSAFYDYLYVSALCQPQNSALAEGLLRFRAFTDIMFNPGTGKARRYNTQARSCAIYVALANRGALDEGMLSFDSFVNEVGYVEKPAGRGPEQTSLQFQ